MVRIVLWLSQVRYGGLFSVSSSLNGRASSKPNTLALEQSPAMLCQPVAMKVGMHWRCFLQHFSMKIWLLHDPATNNDTVVSAIVSFRAATATRRNAA